jgi:hypothetical protein
MGSNRLFNPMPDIICRMSFYSSDRLFNYFKSVAKQASSDLLGRTCSEIFAEQANDLLCKELANRRLAFCELAGEANRPAFLQLVEQLTNLLAKSRSFYLLAKSRLTCSKLAKQAYLL